MYQHGSCIKHGWKCLLELNLVTGIHPGTIHMSGVILFSIQVHNIFLMPFFVPLVLNNECSLKNMIILRFLST